MLKCVLFELTYYFCIWFKYADQILSSVVIPRNRSQTPRVPLRCTCLLSTCLEYHITYRGCIAKGSGFPDYHNDSETLNSMLLRLYGEAYTYIIYMEGAIHTQLSLGTQDHYVISVICAGPNICEKGKSYC